MPKKTLNKKSKVKRYAIRQKESDKGRIGRHAGKVFAFFTVAICFFAFIGFFPERTELNFSQLREEIITKVKRPVASVKIEGSFRRVDQEVLRQTIEPFLDKAFVDIDLEALKIELETDAWVKAARLSRLWPDTLKIQIVEQTPIARWGEQAFLNNQGDVIKLTARDTRELRELPMLSGDQKHSGHIRDVYLDLSQLLNQKNLTIVGLTLDQMGSWQVKVDKGFDIFLGKGDEVKKIRNFIMVYESRLSSISNEIFRVDIRYQNGLAVKWKDQNFDYVEKSRGLWQKSEHASFPATQLVQN